MTGAADDGGEDSPGGIVSGEASLHKTGAVVAHKGGSLFVVTHDGFCQRGGGEEKQEFSSPAPRLYKLYVTEMTSPLKTLVLPFPPLLFLTSSHPLS